MRDFSELGIALRRIDGRGYKAYKQIEGPWHHPHFEVHIDHVQGDPFADPTRVRVQIGSEACALPEASYRSPSRALGTSAFLARAFAAGAADASRSLGSGRSGEFRMEHPGQKVMLQTALRVDARGSIEARLTVGLPSQGRRVAGHAATEMLTSILPALVLSNLTGSAHDSDDIEDAAATNEDAESLRAALASHDMVAFVADGAVLPRRSGIDDHPLGDGTVVPFRSPESLRVEVQVPNGGTVTGMGVPTGVTLVVGGGFHGKSTLLRALEAGVYNHRPGDGRERVVTRSDAVKIRAEDGRSVAGVDISSFIDGLPLGRDTHRFSTPNASGSTSQAAAIVEALEAGSRILLVDEDTSATNFMIRDRRMQELVPDEAEPITPFVDRVRDLQDESGVSCVLVIGGSGDYLDVADLVLRMRDYLAEDVTAEAREVAEQYPTGRSRERPASRISLAVRNVDSRSVDPRRGRRPRHVRAPDDRTLLFGSETIDLMAVEQLASRAQTRAIGNALAYMSQHVLPSHPSIPEALEIIDELQIERGPDAFDDRLTGDTAMFRKFELAATLNRLRALRVDCGETG